ncbi:hypothetical protein [Komagataeibacter xylinus]|uniref:hypothetical protein n=1 Tax=Komagataeibacter xylinus TaxID=28448 RepID=UPI00280C1133|nr:hypothetical protein [Komagataeibacter xylinus]
MRVKLRYLPVLLASFVAWAWTVPAAAKTDLVCTGQAAGIRLHVDGLYGGYPHSVLRQAVLRSVACPTGPDVNAAFLKIAQPAPHLRVSVIRPIGQGQQGSISVMLFSRGQFVIGERMGLSVLSHSQSPFVVSNDINLATQRMWDDLAARMKAGGPVVP